MKTIWKFELEKTDEQVVQMPVGAEILCANVQRWVICLWAEVESSNPVAERLITIHGTGHPMDDSTPVYVGTVFDGPLVWHVYDHGEAKP